ncbi:hypothetical protein ACFQY5_00545 [Paeniroseomonas aquatica]|uniref:Uncharacterized protein n=1 Tax=Paeniroseomonas aquatica TaxID=373043 RepID=A0ABT8A0G2_9PROT|nr:hypothetical protein [Paeniroseomonas aquatica]MDN3563222.1 hypothetical protein [Paeniroseomonas aquatica]
MTTITSTLIPEADRMPLSWAPQAATILAAFALSFAMPVGTVLTLALLGATAAGVGIAAQRRHGGEGMPALPHALED